MLSHARTTDGFTLLELLVVLAILGMLSALVAPAISRSLSGPDIVSTVRSLVSNLNLARSTAITRNQEVALTIDLDKHEYTITGLNNKQSLPDNIDIRMLTVENELIDETRAAIRFFPDGSSTGGRVTISGNNTTQAVDINWLTGQTRIIELEQ